MAPQIEARGSSMFLKFCMNTTANHSGISRSSCCSETEKKITIFKKSHNKKQQGKSPERKMEDLTKASAVWSLYNCDKVLQRHCCSVQTLVSVSLHTFPLKCWTRGETSAASTCVAVACKGKENGGGKKPFFYILFLTFLRSCWVTFTFSNNPRKKTNCLASEDMTQPLFEGL